MLEEHLSEAVKALLKEQPSEPIDFICKFLARALRHNRLRW